MKANIIACTLFGLFVAMATAYADETSKAFYSKCIETEIQHCQVRAERLHSRSERIRKDAETARSQVHYYESNRNALVEQMDQEKVSAKNHKVRRYLLDAYHESQFARE